VISPFALEAVRRIDELFEIERTISGRNPERRRAVRQALGAGPLPGIVGRDVPILSAACSKLSTSHGTDSSLAKG
jgi:hypothetical protein